MPRSSGLTLGILALSVYIVGGILAFAGIGLVVFMNGRDLFGWGDGRTLGWFFLCLGVSLSILGVLMMRLFRNRGVA
ncbi:MAG: hypothetical protein Fur0034_10170 [Desulfuromonadia bacterium]